MNSSLKTKTNTHYTRYIYLYKNDWTLETYPIESSNEKIWSKNSIKIDRQNHHMEDKKEKGEREGQRKVCNSKEPKKGKK
jgi:hypothetical protein